MVEDFLRLTRMERGGREPTPRAERTDAGDAVADPMHRLVLLALAAGPATVDEVARAVGLSVREASVVLAMLELSGKLVSCGPGRYAVT